MNPKAAWLISLFSLFLRYGLTQQDFRDSCDIRIPTWFEPDCYNDTCIAGGPWEVSYTENCLIERVHYKVYDQTEEKVIYEADKAWNGLKVEPYAFYETGYYPYELTFYTKDKKSFVRKGKVFLYIW